MEGDDEGDGEVDTAQLAELLGRAAEPVARGFSAVWVRQPRVGPVPVAADFDRAGVENNVELSRLELDDAAREVGAHVAVAAGGELVLCLDLEATPTPDDVALSAAFRGLDEGSQWAFRAAVQGDTKTLARGARDGADLETMVELASRAKLTEVAALLTAEVAAQAARPPAERTALLQAGKSARAARTQRTVALRALGMASEMCYQNARSGKADGVRQWAREGADLTALIAMADEAKVGDEGDAAALLREAKHALENETPEELAARQARQAAKEARQARLDMLGFESEMCFQFAVEGEKAGVLSWAEGADLDALIAIAEEGKVGDERNAIALLLAAKEARRPQAA